MFDILICFIVASAFCYFCGEIILYMGNDGFYMARSIKQWYCKFVCTVISLVLSVLGFIIFANMTFIKCSEYIIKK